MGGCKTGTVASNVFHECLRFDHVGMGDNRKRIDLGVDEGSIDGGRVDPIEIEMFSIAVV